MFSSELNSYCPSSYSNLDFQKVTNKKPDCNGYLTNEDGGRQVIERCPNLFITAVQNRFFGDGGVSAAIRRILPYPIRVAVDAAAALVSRIQEALSDPDEPHAQPSAAAGVADHGADIQEFVPVYQFVGDVMAHCGLAALMTGLVLSSLTQTTFVLECVAGLLYLGDEVPALCTRARSSDRSRVGTALELR